MRSLYVWFCLASVFLLGAIAFYTFNFWGGGVSKNQTHWGLFGDYLAFLGPIFSLFALLVLVKTYDQARVQARNAERALEETKKSKREESIEAMFFQLLKRRDDLMANWPEMGWQDIRGYLESLIAPHRSEFEILNSFREGYDKFHPLICAIQAVIYVLQTAQQEVEEAKAKRLTHILAYSLTTDERHLLYCTAKFMMQASNHIDQDDREALLHWEKFVLKDGGIGKKPDNWPPS